MLFSSLAFLLIQTFNPSNLALDRLDQDVYQDYYSKTIFVTRGCSQIGNLLDARLVDQQTLRFEEEPEDCLVLKIKNPNRGNPN